MPIESMTMANVVQVCAVCGDQNTVPMTSLTLGFKLGELEDPGTIMFPDCLSCGAREQMLRYTDPIPSGTGPIASENRKAINALGERLKQLNRTINDLSPGTIAHDYAAEVAHAPADVADIPFTRQNPVVPSAPQLKGTKV